MRYVKSYQKPVFDTASGEVEEGQYAIISQFKYAVCLPGEKPKTVYVNEAMLNENEYLDFNKDNYLVWRKGKDAGLEAKEKFDSTGLKEVESKPYDVSGLTLVELIGEKYLNEFLDDEDKPVCDEITKAEYKDLETSTAIKK